MSRAGHPANAAASPAVRSDFSAGAEHSAALRDAYLDREYRRLEEEGEGGAGGKRWNYQEQSQNARDTKEVDANIERYTALINRPGLVQCHGACLVLAGEGLRVVACSSNSMGFVGTAVQDALGANAEDILSGETVAQLRAARAARDEVEVELLNPFPVRPKVARPGMPPVSGIVHRTEEGLVLDVEPTAALSTGVTSCHRRVVAAADRLRRCDGGEDRLAQVMAEETAALVGFDRVMVYKFHEDMHGEVVGEWTAPGVDSFLGLHWPATDLPQVNRKLFQKVARPRLIADVTMQPVEMMQTDDLDKPALLAGSGLRATLGCHVTYLTNMGVQATLVAPVSVAGSGAQKPAAERRLWGMVVCHNESPRQVDYEVRTALGLLQQVFATRVEQTLQVVEALASERESQANATLVGMLFEEDCSFEHLLEVKPKTLLDVVPADGVAIVLGDRCATGGKHPLTVGQAKSIAKWLLSEGHLQPGGPPGTKRRTFSTKSLSELGYPDAKEVVSAACGVLATVVAPPANFVAAPGVCCVILYTLREFRQNIRWAGAAGGSKHVARAGGLAPRDSFEIIMQEHAMSSAAWHRRQLDAAESLGVLLEESASDNSSSLLRADVLSTINQQRLKSSRDLSKLAAELGALMDTAPMGTLVVDADCKVEQWNAWLEAQTGVRQADAVGSYLTELVTDESQGKASGSRALFQRVMATLDDGTESHDFYLLMHTVGDRPPLKLLASLIPRRSNGSEVDGVVLIGQPTTSVAGTTSDTYVLDSVASPVFAVDSSMRVSLWNKAMERVTGVEAGDVQGKLLIRSVFASEANTGAPLRLATDSSLLDLELAGLRLIDRGEVPDNDLQLTMKTKMSGKSVDVLLTVRKPSTALMQDHSCLFFAQDVSLRRALEKAEAVKLAAEAAAASKTNTISFLCHEIRNPLNGILASTSFLMEDSEELGSLHQELLNTTDTCGKQLRRIVDDVLDLAKIEQGKMTLAEEAFNITTMCRATLSQVLSAAKQKDLTLAYDTSGLQTQHVVGDHTRLMQVVSNLLWNSIKYSTTGQVELHMSSGERYDGKVGLTVSVVDSGQGIDEARMKKLFKAYELSTNDVGKWGSTGLGLHIAQSLTRAMGGELTCYSKVDEGSIFMFTIPLQAAANNVSKSLESVTSGLQEFDPADGSVRLCVSNQHKIKEIAVRSHTSAADSTFSNLATPGASGGAEGNMGRLRSTPESSAAPKRHASFREENSVRGSDSPAGPTASRLQASKSFRQARPSPQLDDNIEQEQHNSDPDMPKYHVLVVDDEPHNLRLLELCLKRIGHKVEMAQSGNQALQKLLDNLGSKYDIVLLDSEMPGMSGREVCERLREYEADGSLHMPVVMVTGNTDDHHRKEYARIGADGIIPKPVSVVELGTDLELFLNKVFSGEQLTEAAYGDIINLAPWKDGVGTQAASVRTQASSSAAPRTRAALPQRASQPEQQPSPPQQPEIVSPPPTASAPVVGGVGRRVPKDPEGTLHMLVVDDEALNLRLLELCLKRLGYTYELATDGDMAYEKLVLPSGQPCRYDLALLDQVMPGRYGSEVATQLREHEARYNLQHLPVIAVTANTLDNDKEKYGQAGMDGLLEKPITINKMGSTIKSFMKAWSTGEPMEETMYGQVINLAPWRASITPPTSVTPRTSFSGAPHTPQPAPQLPQPTPPPPQPAAPAVQPSTPAPKPATPPPEPSVQVSAPTSDVPSTSSWLSMLESVQNKPSFVRPPAQRGTMRARAESAATVLSIDDDTLSQNMLERVLTTLGFKVDLAMTASQAIAHVMNGDHKPDVILLDIRLPDMSGLELCGIMRNMSELTDVPILMVSGQADRDHVIDGLESGGTDFISKPFATAELVARINTHLKLRRALALEVESRTNLDLLKRMLPENVLSRLKSGQKVVSDSYDDLTFIFVDIVGFTRISASLPAAEVVLVLNELYAQFDLVMQRYQNLLRVESRGDSYVMVTGINAEATAQKGLSEAMKRINTSNAIKLCEELLEVTRQVKYRQAGELEKGTLHIRTGVHCGPAFAGVVGITFPHYCFFGDTVNTAARMESTGYPDTIHVSEDVVQRMEGFGTKYEFAEAPQQDVKGKGMMRTYYVKAGAWEKALASIDSNKEKSYRGAVAAPITQPVTAAAAPPPPPALENVLGDQGSRRSLLAQSSTRSLASSALGSSASHKALTPVGSADGLAQQAEVVDHAAAATAAVAASAAGMAAPPQLPSPQHIQAMQAMQAQQLAQMQYVAQMQQMQQMQQQLAYMSMAGHGVTPPGTPGSATPKGVAEGLPSPSMMPHQGHMGMMPGAGLMPGTVPGGMMGPAAFGGLGSPYAAAAGVSPFGAVHPGVSPFGAAPSGAVPGQPHTQQLLQ